MNTAPRNPEHTLQVRVRTVTRRPIDPFKGYETKDALSKVIQDRRHRKVELRISEDRFKLDEVEQL